VSASRSDSDGAALYQYSAEFFDIRYAHKDYASEAAILTKLLDRIHPSAVTLLDVACGTGRHVEYLRSRYQVEALDLNPTLLQIARTRLSDVPLHEADMSSFNLGRSFDVVTCFFASVPYLGSLNRLRDAISSMAMHVAPGGILFVEPGLTPSAYREDEVVHNFRRTPERAISWMYVMRRKGRLAVWDIHWLVGTPEGGVDHFVEHEEFSLFTTEECASAMRDVGLDVVHHARGLHGYGALLGRKRRSWTSDETAVIAEILPG
jgi:SAM-dependent methyltransferase